MSAIDKIKTACWFRRIAMDIDKQPWPADDRLQITNTTNKYRATAARLEDEARCECAQCSRQHDQDEAQAA